MNRKIMVASVVLGVAITAIGDATYAAVKKSRAHQYGTSQSDLQRMATGHRGSRHLRRVGSAAIKAGRKRL
jgi:hypothetical protein